MIDQHQEAAQHLADLLAQENAALKRLDFLADLFHLGDYLRRRFCPRGGIAAGSQFIDFSHHFPPLAVEFQ